MEKGQSSEEQPAAREPGKLLGSELPIVMLRHSLFRIGQTQETLRKTPPRRSTVVRIVVGVIDLTRPYSADVDRIDLFIGSIEAHIERVMNLGEKRIEMRISRSAWFARDLCFPHS